MAIHSELPIYKAAYDLLGIATDLVRNLPRDIKSNIGGKIRDECIEILVLIPRANAANDKAPHISEILERVQVVEFLMRLLRDKRFISVKQYARAAQVTTAIGKQANGWRRAMQASQSRPLRERHGARA